MDHPCLISDIRPCGWCLWCVSDARQKDGEKDTREHNAQGRSKESGKDTECQRKY